jgi:membrane dipeptidase
VIFSHSSAFTVTQHPRNVPDDVLRQVTVNRGVVMVNYLTSYISEPMRKYRLDYEAKRDGLTGSESEIAEEMRVWVEARPAPEVTLYDVADHIDHMVNIAGIDHVGLGADYDGMPPGPVGLEDVSTYPALLKELLIRGYSDKDIAKIAGENILRVMAEAEAVAASLQSLHSPAEIQFTPPESSIEQAN